MGGCAREGIRKRGRRGRGAEEGWKEDVLADLSRTTRQRVEDYLVLGGAEGGCPQYCGCLRRREYRG